jgi:hypothetical protein
MLVWKVGRVAVPRSRVASKLSFGVRLVRAGARGGVEPPDSENRGHGAAVWAVEACFNRFASCKSSGLGLAKAVDAD